MTFAFPLAIILGIVLVPALVLFVIWQTRRDQQILSRLGDESLLRRLSDNVNWQGRRWRLGLWLAAVALLIFALARPQWGSVQQEIQQEGLQVMVALDVSQSMMAADIQPTRLDRAKLEIADLMSRLDGDEIGLVLFSGASFIQVPLTSDYNTALSYLESAGPEVISRPGTVIGDAIRTAMRGFDPDLSSQKVLIIMTDGEDAETDPLAAAAEAAAEDVLIYTIGFGTTDGQPVPMPAADGGARSEDLYMLDAQGNIVLSRLDENTLQAIASAGDGRYYRATASGQELDALLDEIDDLQQALLMSRTEITRIERFQFFLFLAVIALLMAELIPDRIRPRASSWRSLRLRQTTS